MYGKSLGARWWLTAKEAVCDHAKTMGFMTKYDPHATDRKWGIYATMEEYHNIKMTSGAYE